MSAMTNAVPTEPESLHTIRCTGLGGGVSELGRSEAAARQLGRSSARFSRKHRSLRTAGSIRRHVAPRCAACMRQRASPGQLQPTLFPAAASVFGFTVTLEAVFSSIVCAGPLFGHHRNVPSEHPSYLFIECTRPSLRHCTGQHYEDSGHGGQLSVPHTLCTLSVTSISILGDPNRLPYSRSRTVHRQLPTPSLHSPAFGTRSSRKIYNQIGLTTCQTHAGLSRDLPGARTPSPS